ncbi:hypothetical protein M422DRAFT_264177 [Sphaerobolus stellatus SS14]|uniref:Mid2 domain-containing protein n=1 Tax=Sphaerobolus stellatus (strain SS14) TaxID=990650 RepID=A0A0C9TU60_SPHS4|nr:hypothetical protein M422DRAFT_264177 [Sphaerobolus stellatus SS14]
MAATTGLSKGSVVADPGIAAISGLVAHPNRTGTLAVSTPPVTVPTTPRLSTSLGTPSQTILPSTTNTAVSHAGNKHKPSTGSLAVAAPSVTVTTTTTPTATVTISTTQTIPPATIIVSNGVNIPLIIGVAVGGVVGILLIIGVASCILIRRKRGYILRRPTPQQVPNLLETWQSIANIPSTLCNASSTSVPTSIAQAHNTGYLMNQNTLVEAEQYRNDAMSDIISNAGVHGAESVRNSSELSIQILDFPPPSYYTGSRSVVSVDLEHPL